MIPAFTDNSQVPVPNGFVQMAVVAGLALVTLRLRSRPLFPTLGENFSDRVETGKMDDAPWYKDGLQFTCTQCGDCCTGGPGYVWLTNDEIRQIAEYRGLSLGEMQMHHLRYVGGRTSLREFPNGDCTFLDGQTRKCSVYPVRPAQCQTWPFWNSNLASEAAWKRTQVSCPGAGCGKLYSIEEIQTLSEVVDI